MSSPEQLLGVESRSPARHLAAIAAEVAIGAAALVRASTGRAELAGTKSTPTDVVTHTDVASERFIRAELTQRCPGSTIVGEELATDRGSNSVEWIVDPVDGTVNFLYDLPVVAVSIAARLDGCVVAGAVADVLRGDVFSAALGEGATLNGQRIGVASAGSMSTGSMSTGSMSTGSMSTGSMSTESMSTESMSTGSMSTALIGTGFAYDARTRAEQAAVLQRLLPAARDIRCMGSAALNLCWVGCGRLDGYYERGTKLYDYAAAAIVASEAGAIVELPEPDVSDLVLGAHPAIFAELRSLTRPVT